MIVMRQKVTDADYRALAEFRSQLRQFLRFSEGAARDAGLEPQQHQLLLVLKAVPPGEKATVARLADSMQLRHHSAVELLDRLEAKRLARRLRDTGDRRQVLVQLTPAGERLLRRLSLHHLAELRSTGPLLVGSLRRVLSGVKPAPGAFMESLNQAIQLTHWR